jgi:hypothetical protein
MLWGLKSSPKQKYSAHDCGEFGQNWARWLALAWIAFHVVLSALHPIPELIIHAVFCAVFAWLLFRPEAARYFRGAQSEPA